MKSTGTNAIHLAFGSSAFRANCKPRVISSCRQRPNSAYKPPGKLYPVQLYVTGAG